MDSRVGFPLLGKSKDSGQRWKVGLHRALMAIQDQQDPQEEKIIQNPEQRGEKNHCWLFAS